MTPDLCSRIGVETAIPSHLRESAIPGYLESRLLVKSASVAIDTARIPSVQMGPRYGLVHGRLPNSAPQNLFEAPNWSWDAIKCGDRLYSLTSRPNASPPQRLAEVFAARPHRARALRMGTGSLYYLPGEAARLADKMPDGRLSLWADDTINDLRQRWREQFGDWYQAGLIVYRVDADIEIQKQWFLHDDKRPGHPGRLTLDWLKAQRQDDRWDEFAARWFPDLTETDWNMFGTWQSTDPRYVRWNAVAELRTTAYYRALVAAIREFWPDARVGSSNVQFFAYPQFGRGRRNPWGCGDAWDYSSGKVYTEAELTEAESAVAASSRGWAGWPQDNAEDRQKFPDKRQVWTIEGQASVLRHLILLSGDLSPVLSVDNGLPSTEKVDGQRTPLEILGDLLRECDKMTGGRLGLPLPPQPRKAGQSWRQTTVDCGDRLVRWLSYPSVYDDPQAVEDGWKFISGGALGSWWEKAG